MTEQVKITPTVGMGATIQFWSDRQAATIIAVNGRTVTVQADLATRTDDNGMSECQSYNYYPNPNGAIYKFSLRKDGRYHEVGVKMYGGCRLHIGVRDNYYDFSF